MGVSTHTKTIQAYAACSTEGCNHVTEFRRIRGRKHSVGHTKTLYCIKCRKDTDHIEQSIDKQFVPQWILDQEKQEKEKREAYINEQRRKRVLGTTKTN